MDHFYKSDTKNRDHFYTQKTRSKRRIKSRKKRNENERKPPETLQIPLGHSSADDKSQPKMCVHFRLQFCYIKQLKCFNKNVDDNGKEKKKINIFAFVGSRSKEIQDFIAIFTLKSYIFICISLSFYVMWCDFDASCSLWYRLFVKTSSFSHNSHIIVLYLFICWRTDWTDLLHHFIRLILLLYVLHANIYIYCWLDTTSLSLSFLLYIAR